MYNKVKVLVFLINSFVSCVQNFGTSTKTKNYFYEQLDRLESIMQITAKEKRVFKSFLSDVANMQTISMVHMVANVMLSKGTGLTESAVKEILKSYYTTTMINDATVVFIGDFLSIAVYYILENRSVSRQSDMPKSGKNAQSNQMGTNKNKQIEIVDGTSVLSYNAFLKSEYYVCAKAEEQYAATLCSGQKSVFYLSPEEIDKKGIPTNFVYSGLCLKVKNENYDGCSCSREYIYEEVSTVTLNDLAIKWIMRWKYKDARKPPVEVEKPVVKNRKPITLPPTYNYDPCKTGSGSNPRC